MKWKGFIFHFRSINHLTGFYLILPITEKNMFENVFDLLYSIKFVIFVKFNVTPILFL